MYIAILGRQPALGMAELEAVFGNDATRWFSDQSALMDIDEFDIQKFGGTQKAGHVVAEINNGDWRRVSMKVVQAYTTAWTGFNGKITLGISAYGFDVSPRDIQKTGIILKQKLKKQNVSLRLLPNSESALNTATAHHNKLGLASNKVELLIVRSRSGRIIIAESTGSQNITAIALRDQGRPKRDAFVGMLPPKLAQIMINLAHPAQGVRILDPFCGTGVVLQEAALLGYSIYGTDLAEKMVRYSKENLEWLRDTHHLDFDSELDIGDAIEKSWHGPIDAIVCETYLGQPFSAPPAPDKLDQVKRTCNQIISMFLENASHQIKSGSALCVAVPAWRDSHGTVTHLPLISQLETLGYTKVSFKNVKASELLYYREDQIVARELLVLTKT
jgi:tRNA G10  N-methylase Trm11